MSDTIASLEAQIASAMTERLPQVHQFLVRPFQVSCRESNTWVVARSGAAGLCISLETERFGVGFLSDDLLVLENVDFYPSAELAAQSFGWALANGA